MNLLNKISNIFRKKEESFNIVDTDIHVLKSEFSSSEYIMEGCISEFPTIVSLTNYDVKAAYGLVLLDDIAYKNLNSYLITKLQRSSSTFTLNEVEKLTLENHKYLIKIEKDFNGILFSFVTDDAIFLKDIINLKIQPPPPWIATNLEPKGFLFPQGKEEYYWNTFWLRFYEKLDPIELENYLKEYDVPSKWVEYFQIMNNKLT